MNVNLSQETIDVIVNALVCSRAEVKKSIKKATDKGDSNKLEIAKKQLRDIENTLSIFEEE